MCSWRPVLCGLLIPCDGSLTVIGHTLTQLVHSAESILRLGKGLISSFSKPEERLPIILRHPPPVSVHHT